MAILHVLHPPRNREILHDQETEIRRLQIILGERKTRRQGSEEISARSRESCGEEREKAVLCFKRR